MATSRRRGTVKQVAHGKWLVRLSLGNDANGRRVRHNKIINGSKADADRYLTKLLNRKDDGLPAALSRQGLGTWLEEWLSKWCHHLSPRTLSDYRSAIQRHVTPELAARPLAHLTPTDLQDLINDMTARGLSPRTVQSLRGIVRAALNQAMRLGKVGRNVATLVTLPKMRHSERRVLTAEEAQRLLAKAEEAPWGAFFVVLLLTGVRPGEALGLKWEDIDGGTLRVRRAVTRGEGESYYLAAPKTGRPRVIALGERALRALRRHRADLAEWKLKLGSAYEDNGLIFAAQNGAIAHRRNVIKRYWKPLLKRCELPKDLRLYDLRHSHATLLMAAGEHPKIVQERLGHSSIRLTLDTYTHVVPGMQERAAARLDDLLEREATAKVAT